MSTIYDKSDIAAMSPITQKLAALLKAEGFSMLEAGRTDGANNTPVNRLVYMNGQGEKVFFYVHEDLLPGEIAARMESIFQGTPGEKAGRRWIDSEMSDPAYTAGTAIEGIEGRFYHKMIHEPELGAELPCFWDSHSKTWQPDYPWPTVLQQEDYKGESEEG